MANVELQNTQFKYRTDEVIYTIKLPHPLGSDQIISTEASIRSRMATPAENWGNADTLVDAQACVDEKYPGWGFMVVPESEPDLDAPPEPPFAPATALTDAGPA
jgi:hypothetical protein